MRLHFGAPPESLDSFPEADAWLPLREPSPNVLVLCAFPIGIALMLGIAHAWQAIGGGLDWLSEQVPTLLLFYVPAAVMVIPVHELTHAAFTPRAGCSSRTVLGLWPRKAMCYAYYDGEITRNRHMVIAAAPFVLLTLVPLAMCAVLSIKTPFVIAFTLANGLGASGDILGMAIVGLQLPSSAVLRNKGYRTWWRVPAQQAHRAERHEVDC